MTKEKQIEEMVASLKEYTAKNHIMASVVILEDYAEQIYNAGYRKQSEWISVKDRLPETDDKVLCCEASGEMYVGMYLKTRRVAGWITPYSGDRPITHWMPIPEPPKMKGGAEEW